MKAEEKVIEKLIPPHKLVYNLILLLTHRHGRLPFNITLSSAFLHIARCLSSAACCQASIFSRDKKSGNEFLPFSYLLKLKPFKALFSTLFDLCLAINYARRKRLNICNDRPFLNNISQSP